MDKKVSFCWDREATDPVIISALDTLSARYPELKGKRKGSTELVFIEGEDENTASLAKTKTGYVITYGRPNMALRMVGALLSGITKKDDEECPFETFGIMLDCSRNAVMKVEHLKTYLDRLAILGYNMIMLYTEDTYRLEGESFFGFMRGAYTKEEIREIDDYAASLGIELIPCIQALGHLEQIFKWGKNTDILDRGSVMLVDEEKTYQLIDKMLEFWSSAVRSRRVHLGMDEAWQLGTGKYKELHGEVSRFDILTGHLAKCNALCDKYGLKPMIWSDMFYRIGSKTGDYYDLTSQPSDEVAKQIPEGLELVYWDYYHDDQSFYEKHIDKHRALGCEPLMGSAVWTWSKFWYDQAITRRNVTPCLKACRAKKLKEVFFTMWGDEGAFCDFDSAFAGLAFSAELAFRGEADDKRLEKLVSGLFYGASYKAVTALAEVMTHNIARLIFDDPLMLIFTRSFMIHKEGEWKDCILGGDFAWHKEKIEAAVKALKSAPDGDCGDIYYAAALAGALKTKLDYAEAAIAASELDSHRAVAKNLLKLARKYEDAIAIFSHYFVEMWHRHNKPFGLEATQIRLAAQQVRAEELTARLEEFIQSSDEVIPELAEIKRVGNDLTISCWSSFLDVAKATTTF